MRVLVSTSPGLGHFLPLVPLAWALRSAGHEVLVASTGPALQAAGEVGLPGLDTARGVDIAAIFRDYMTVAAKAPPADPMASTLGLFGRIGDAMADGAVEAVELWRPEAVLHAPFDGAGPLAAARLGVPAVHHGVGLGLSEPQVAALRAGLVPAYLRHGVPADHPAPAAVVDVCPPSLRPDAAMPGWPMRYVPYNGGGTLPDWVLASSGRPRLCITLGSVLPGVSGVGTLQAVVDAVALLPTCAAVVHHGGAGTAFAAVVAGVPQLVLPHAGDQHANAAAVRRRGLGITADPHRVDIAAVRADLCQLLEDGGLRRAAGEVRQEVREQPAPLEVVPLVTGVACP